MADFILIDGDKAIFLPNFGVAVVVVRPGDLKGSGPATLDGKKALRRRRREERRSPGLYLHDSQPFDPRYGHAQDRLVGG